MKIPNFDDVDLAIAIIGIVAIVCGVIVSIKGTIPQPAIYIFGMAISTIGGLARGKDKDTPNFEVGTILESKPNEEIKK